jgi:hypothetical protein
MAEPILDIRPVAAKIDDKGQVTFNQTVMLQDPHQPAGVLLVAIDERAEGGAPALYLWLRPQADVQRASSSQAKGYSESIGGSIDRVREILGGEPVLVSRDRIPNDLWDKIVSARTNALHKLFAEALA